MAAPPAASEEQQKDKVGDEGWLKNVDFMMYQFKVALCNKHCDHDWDTCPYAHIGERTCRRRDPARVNYTSTICVDMMQRGRCPKGRSCTAAHTIYEYWLHPHRYRTEMCKVGVNCTRRICFFAHKPEELRPLPSHLVGTSGGPSAGKYSLSATRQAAAAAAAAGARHNAGFCGSIHPAAAFPQQPAAYALAEQASWGFIPQAASMMSVDSSSMAGCLAFPGVMQHSHLQQHQPAAAAGMGHGGMGLLQGDPTGWQQQQQQHHSGGYSAGTSLTEMSLLAHMQQLRLTGSAPNTPPAHSAPMGSGGMNFLPMAAQWQGMNSVAGLAAGSNPDLAGQQYFGSDGLLHGWQQEQHQHQQPAPLLQDASQAFAGGPFALPGASRMLVMQQPQQLAQLMGDHNAAFAKAMGSVPMGDVGAGFQQLLVKVVQGSAGGGAWQHTQDSWLLPRAPGC